MTNENTISRDNFRIEEIYIDPSTKQDKTYTKKIVNKKNMWGRAKERKPKGIK